MLVLRGSGIGWKYEARYTICRRGRRLPAFVDELNKAIVVTDNVVQVGMVVIPVFFAAAGATIWSQVRRERIRKRKVFTAVTCCQH
jgi:activator of 2-hydroxyglutaryl-CoA dehydratase